MTKVKILIIDDDYDFRETTKIILESENYDVLTASDGDEGLTLARKEKPNIILLDVMMPGYDGYYICRQIKDDPVTCDIPVIMVTCLGQVSEASYSKMIAKHHKADGYLDKPVNKDALHNMISGILNSNVEKTRSSHRKKRVLIIDDDTDVLSSLELVLQRSGYEIYIAESAIEGIKLAKAFHPDAIILDVMLPDKDGYTVCYELKKDNDTHKIPVLILTALPEKLSDPGYAQNIAQDHLADDYASKPITPNDLLSRIKRLIEKNSCLNREP